MSIKATQNQAQRTVSFRIDFSECELYRVMSPLEALAFATHMERGNFRAALFLALSATERRPATSEPRAHEEKPTEVAKNSGFFGVGGDDQHYLG